MRVITRMLLLASVIMVSETGTAADFKSHISLKQPGNAAKTYQLTEQNGMLTTPSALPISIKKEVDMQGTDEVLTIKINTKHKVYINFGAELSTDFATDDCEFYMPGFWYHKNLRSPKEAPSFHTSKSWNFREDRLSSPLVGVYDAKTGNGVTVLRHVDEPVEALVAAMEGEVILSGSTSLGYLGFDNESGTAKLTFGYPYVESPKRYIRKLTLAPSVTSFVKLEPGETKVLTWRIHHTAAKDFGQFVSDTWEYCFDRLNPTPVKALYTAEQMKAQLTNYFRKSFVDKYQLKYNSGMTIPIDDCKPSAEVQIGFCGRVLLNAFNEIEYGEAHKQQDLVRMGTEIFDSFLANGFTPRGYFHDFVNFKIGMPKDGVHSIRQQSEAIYAVLHYLKYERDRGRMHREWEKKMRYLLDNLITLQKADGHFARKFNDDGSDVDASGGSTPSATSTLVMGYKYFGDKNT